MKNSCRQGNAVHIDQRDTTKQPVIEVYSQSGDGFVVTPESISVSSSYNEDRIFIACKRMLDNTFAPLVLRKKQDLGDGAKEWDVPEASLFIDVGPSMSVVLLFILLAGAGRILISIGPDFVTSMFGLMVWNINWLDAAQYSAICKGFGGLLVILAGYVAVRKLPIGK